MEELFMSNFKILEIHVLEIAYYSFWSIILCSACVAFFLLYFYIRPKLPISVNCWFCNKNTSLPYQLRNGWDCPHCEQYNGFTKDGDYNADIFERRGILSLNHSNEPVPSQRSPTNGLCKICNTNQQLKVQQLARFTPINDKNYDIEVEHFKQQLEKSYSLCKPCQNVLDETLLAQSITLNSKSFLPNVQLDNIVADRVPLLERAGPYLRKISFFLLLKFTILSFLSTANIDELTRFLPYSNSLHHFVHYLNDIFNLVPIVTIPTVGFILYALSCIGRRRHIDDFLMLLWGVLGGLTFISNHYPLIAVAFVSLLIHFKTRNISAPVFHKKVFNRSPIFTQPQTKMNDAHLLKKFTVGTNRNSKSPKKKLTPKKKLLGKNSTMDLNNDFNNLSVGDGVKPRKETKTFVFDTPKSYANIIKPAKFTFNGDHNHDDDISRSSTPSSGYSSQRNFEKSDALFNNLNQSQKLSPNYNNLNLYEFHTPNMISYPTSFQHFTTPFTQAAYYSFTRPTPYPYAFPATNQRFSPPYEQFLSPISPRLSDTSSVINQNHFQSFQSQQKWYAWKNLFYIASACFNLISLIVLFVSYWTGSAVWLPK